MRMNGSDWAIILGTLFALMLPIAWVSFLVRAIYTVVTWLVTL